MRKTRRLFRQRDIYDPAKTDALFVEAMAENAAYQYAHCADYCRILDEQGFSPDRLRAVEDLARLPFGDVGTLKRYKGYLQTAAVLTPDPQRRQAICQRLAAVGVVRLTSAGRMSRMVCGEAHDGTYALREYSRIVETEIYE